MNSKILVTLTPSDAFITLQTYDARHGKSQNFYIRKETILFLKRPGSFPGSKASCLSSFPHPLSPYFPPACFLISRYSISPRMLLIALYLLWSSNREL